MRFTGHRTHAALLPALVCVAALVIADPAVTQGQQPAVTGIGDFPHGTSNVAQAIMFYRDVLGFELINTHPPMAGGTMGPNVYDARMQALMDVGGAYYRFATLRIPGAAFRLQLVEMVNNQHVIGARGRRQSSAAHTERGGLMLRLAVADIDALSKRIRGGIFGDVLATADGSAGAEPRRFVFRDETDGFLIDVVQAVNGTGIVLTAANSDEKLRFYRDLLGFQLQTGPWEPDATASEAGAPGAERQRSVGRVPGTDVPFAIDEYRGIHQRRFYSTTMGQDGVGWLQFLVRDLDGLMKVFVRERVWIVSTGLQPVTFDDSRRVVVRDPDGVFVELVEPRGGGGGR